MLSPQDRTILTDTIKHAVEFILDNADDTIYCALAETLVQTMRHLVEKEATMMGYGVSQMVEGPSGPTQQQLARFHPEAMARAAQAPQDMQACR